MDVNTKLDNAPSGADAEASTHEKFFGDAIEVAMHQMPSNLLSTIKDGISTYLQDKLPPLALVDEVSINSDSTKVGDVQTNPRGDTFEMNEDGQITKFTYAETGVTFEMKYDENGEVRELTNSNGDVWTKLQPGESFPAPADGGWDHKNEITGEYAKSAQDLGKITVLGNGLLFGGQSPPIVPELYGDPE